MACYYNYVSRLATGVVVELDAGWRERGYEFVPAYVGSRIPVREDNN